MSTFFAHCTWHGAGHYACSQTGQNSIRYHMVNGENSYERSQDAKRCGLGTPTYFESKEDFEKRTGGRIDFDYEMIKTI